jgi:hypothetical protein
VFGGDGFGLMLPPGGFEMSDGREEREEREKRRKQEEQESKEDRVDRERTDEWEPERGGS